MKNSLHRVLNKMPQGKVKKAELRSAKPMAVKLAKVDEVYEMVSSGYGNLEFALEMFYEGREKIIGARDIFRFDMNDYLTGVDEFSVLVENLEDLGVEFPDEVLEIQNMIEDTSDKWNELHQEFENLGVNPMRDRI